jgi:hypothetical protein
MSDLLLLWPFWQFGELSEHQELQVVEDVGEDDGVLFEFC